MIKDLDGKVAFITGGASGIGLGMSEAFGRRGMKVMIADIETERMLEAVDRLQAQGMAADGITLDVSDRHAVVEAAEKTLRRFGKVHVVCNNAGVTANGPVGAISPGDWDWVIDVNLMGVIHGTEAFLPHLRSHGEGGHFVNTASVAGLIAVGSAEPYVGTKFAVVGLSESWAPELAPEGIGISVLCPGFVQSRINDSKRNRSPRYGETAKHVAGLAVNVPNEQLNAGTPAILIGERVVEGILSNELFIFPHTEFEPLVRARYGAIIASADKVRQSQFLPQDPGPTLPSFIETELAEHAASREGRS